MHCYVDMKNGCRFVSAKRFWEAIYFTKRFHDLSSGGADQVTTIWSGVNFDVSGPHLLTIIDPPPRTDVDLARLHSKYSPLQHLLDPGPDTTCLPCLE